MKVERLDRVIAALRARSRRYGKEPNISAVVGYTAAYALWVHENPNAVHPVGNWNFLLGPAMRLQATVANMVRQALRQGRTLAQALLLGALRIQRESMQECPVDTGNLRASAFTKIERGE